MATSLAFKTESQARQHDRSAQSAGEALLSLVGIGITVTAEAGQTIVVEGDPIDHYYRIVSGTVRLFKAIADGRRQVIDFLSDGGCFGLTGLQCHGYSVEAVTEVTMIRYSRCSAETALQSNPELARRLFELACAELERAQRQMLLLGRKTADERIASFLLRLAASQDGPPDVVTLPMSRLDIGDHLGLTIETVSRTLSRFKRDGWIAFPNRQQIELLRPDRLHDLADGELSPAA